MSTKRDPAVVLLGETRCRVLRLLLCAAATEAEPPHLRAIARRAGVAVGALQRDLRLLIGLGLIERRPVGRQVTFAARRDHPLAGPLTELLAVGQPGLGIAGRVSAALGPLRASVAHACVYGPAAASPPGPGDDLSVLVVGPATFAEAYAALRPVEAATRRRLNLVVLPTAARGLGPLAERVRAGPRVVVVGDDDGLDVWLDVLAGPVPSPSGRGLG